MSDTQARFITLEGGEGAGKSTLTKALTARLSTAGIRCDVTREPGGTANAEAIRTLLVEGDKDRWHPLSEALLLNAARFDHVERRIKPALASGQWVICDRFYDSTFAYQGAAGKLDTAHLMTLNEVTLGAFKPNLTFILDLDPEIGLARTVARGEAITRFEAKGMDFHHALRQAFLDIAARDPQRCVILDASQGPEAVEAAAWSHLQAYL